MKDYLEEEKESGALAEAVRRMDGMLDLRGGGAGGVNAGDREESSLAAGAVEMEPVREGRVLLHALGQADRRGAGMAALEAGTERAQTAGHLEDGRDPFRVGGPSGGGMDPGGAVTAENVDRMFRRDSRRYDRGFFLY